MNQVRNQKQNLTAFSNRFQLISKKNLLRYLLVSGSGLLLEAAAGLRLSRLLTFASLVLGAKLLTLAGGLAALAGGTACASPGSHDCESLRVPSSPRAKMATFCS